MAPMARIREKRNTQIVLVGKQARDNVDDLGLNRKAILNGVLKKQDGMSWAAYTATAYGQLAAHYEDSAPWS